MCSRLVRFLDGNGVVTTYQHGFLKKSSTVDAVYSAVTKLLESHQNKQTIAVSLNLSEAFDSIDRSILFEKLEKYEIVVSS